MTRTEFIAELRGQAASADDTANRLGGASPKAQAWAAEEHENANHLRAAADALALVESAKGAEVIGFVSLNVKPSPHVTRYAPPGEASLTGGVTAYADTAAEARELLAARLIATALAIRGGR